MGKVRKLDPVTFPLDPLDPVTFPLDPPVTRSLARARARARNTGRPKCWGQWIIVLFNMSPKGPIYIFPGVQRVRKCFCK